MRIKHLLPVYTASGTVNIILMVLIGMLGYKNMRLGQREFYRGFIMLFISLAYFSRIAEYVYVSVVLPNEVYNRPLITWKFDPLLNFFSYAPVAFHTLGGLSYCWRWVHYYFLATAATVDNQRKIEFFAKANRIMFFSLIALSLISIILVTVDERFFLACIIFEVVFYTFVAVALQLVINMFLFKLKMFLYHVYMQKRTVIRIYSYLISFCLLFRAASLVMDTVIQRNNDWVPGQLDDNNDIANRINDYIMLSFYFIELTPSIIIIVVLWKSNNELKYKQITGNLPNLSLVDRSNNEDSKLENASLTRPLDENSYFTEELESGNHTSYDSRKNPYTTQSEGKKSDKGSKHGSTKDTSPLVNPKAAMTYY